MKYILYLVFSFVSYWVCAQNITIAEIPTINQLPVNAIHCIFRDSEGYMWYGTVDGLCRDDGYQVKVFRSDVNTPGLLDDNRVGCIAEDKEGKIWFGTDEGGYILDKSDYSIKPLDKKRLKNKRIMYLYATSDSAMWVGYYAALAKYNADGKLIKEYSIHNESEPALIAGVCESRNHDVLVAIGEGLVYYLDKQRDELVPYPDKMKRRNIGAIMQDKDNDYFWLATWGDGIVRFNPSVPEDSMFVYSSLPVNASGKEDGVIFSIAQDDKLGYIWATTEHDFMVFEPQANGQLEQINFPGNILPANCMLAGVMADKSSLWISAFDRSSFIIHLKDNNTQDYALPALRTRTNCNPAIMALCDAGDGIMWIMQERTGLALYDLKSDKMSVYSDFPALHFLHLNTGRELTEAHIHKGIWMARDRSQQIYNISRQGMAMKLESTIDLHEQLGKNTTVTELHEDIRGNLWIGMSKGLGIYDIREKKIKEIHTNIGHVTGIAESSEGQIWICTKDNGLFQATPDGKLYSFPSEKSFSCLSIALDGIVWLGTRDGGIYAYSPFEKKLSDYSEACDMNGNEVNQVVVDAFNHIWIDTNQMLIEFNPHNGSFRTYLTTDKSILLRRFLPTAVCQGKDGNIYFGGIPGICMVTPSNRLERKASCIKVRITDIKIQEESLIFSKKKSNKSISRIELQPDGQNLKIYFSSLNHRYASKVRYAYRLVGVDKNWVYTEGGNNTAFYNHLYKGTYTFQVKATDENGLWSDEVTELTICQLPAFYETWWAYLFYTLVVFGIVGYNLRIYQKRLKRKNNEMWEDSEEMVKMRIYLDSKVNLPELEFAQLDKILLEKATKAVEDNLTVPDFDVNALAEATNMSRSTLTRKLKAITGRTPLGFIRNIKMIHAKHMLEDKDRNVTEVAATLGYFNRKYFTACFKDEFGMTPSEFQKSLSEEK